MKKLSILLALVASIGTIFAESGTCGANLTWDLTDGVLTISGTGPMTNWYSSSYVPWYSLKLGWKPIASFIENNTIEIQAVYEADAPFSAPAEYVNPTNPAQKLIRNGNVYILTGDRTYTLTGQEVK